MTPRGGNSGWFRLLLLALLALGGCAIGITFLTWLAVQALRWIR